MNKYVPNMIFKSIFDIDYKELKEKGINVLLFDLDNTIIPDDVKEINDDIRKLFNDIKSFDIKPIIFSNSIKPNKVKRICSDLDIDYVYLAFKPLPFRFDRLIKKYRLDKKEIAIIGDQIFTDVLGGNRVGITTILVKPICDNDFFLTKINRIREKKVMNKYNINF